MKLIKNIAIISILIAGVSCEKTENIVPDFPCTKEINNHPNAAKYQKLMERLLQIGIPGVTMTVITPEGTFSKTGGKADIKNNISLSPCHTMRVGSVTKIFTSVAILKLQDEGKLNIDDKINKYLPSTITDKLPNGNDATIKQLLRHQSGIPEYSTISNNLLISNYSIKRQSAAEIISNILEKKAVFSAGKGQEYSNTNYILLGMILKSISGKSANEVLKEKIISPLDLQNTFVSNEIPSSLSRAYNDIHDKGLMVDRTEIENNAVGGEDILDGGIISNSFDLATFLHALTSGQILSPKAFDQMREFITITQDLGDLTHIKEYGLGLMKLQTDHGIAIGHYGSVQSFNALLYHFPDQKVTVAIIRNGESTEIKKVFESKELFNYLFENK
jgi:D-alanyl-D-alanine carboxypeptidase